MTVYPTFIIKKFLGMFRGSNKIGVLPGQLTRNENYLYLDDGSLEERGGGAKLSDPPSAGVIYGAGNLFLDDGTQYLITVQGTTIYYYDSGWTAVKDSATPTNNFALSTADTKMRFENAGYTTVSTYRSLYGVNANELVVKIYKSGSNIVAQSIASSPTDLIQLKLHKNRLFGIDGKDTLYFTDVLAFDTWNTGTNNIQIAPGNYGRLKAIEIFGDALFIFKEYAVFVLPNAQDSSPTTSWKILKTDSYTGTQSTDSVRLTNNGIYYFATDNYIRKISLEITFSSAEYTLGGSSSPIVSYPVQKEIQELLSVSAKSNISAIVFKDKYIVSFQTVNNSSAYNDKTYFIDLNKFLPLTKEQELQKIVPQPFYGAFTGFNYNYFVIQNASGQDKLYGFKGALSGSEGECHETLNDSVHNDDSAAISSYAVLGWVAPGGESTYKRFKTIAFFGDTEDWYINLKINAYKIGKTLPLDGEGISKSFTTSTSAAAITGTALVGTASLSALGISSSKYRLSLKGHYFSMEFSNLNVNQLTRINKIIIEYMPIKSM